MLETLMIVGLVLVLRIGQDTLFLAKIDAFNRGNKYYSMGINFIEAIYGITVISVILKLMEKNPLYVVFFGAGSMLGGLLSAKIKEKLDRKVIGQRQYLIRISLDNNIDRSELIQTLKDADYEFTLSTREYISGRYRLIIEGSVENRTRMLQLKEILRGRPSKHVTILRADEMYFLK